MTLAAVLLWANSAPGRASLERLAKSQLPGLMVENLQGPLPGRIALGRLTLADAAGTWLEIEGAELAWDPWALLRRELRITALTANALRLHRLPAGEEPAAEAPPGPILPHLPQLPLALRLERLHLPVIELAEPVLGVATVLRAGGQAALDPWGLSLGLEARGDAGTWLALDASLRPGTGRLAARIALRDPAGGPLGRLAGLPARPLALDLTLDGPAEAAALQVTAAAGPGLALEAAGEVRAPDTSRLGLALEGRAELAGVCDVAGLPHPGPFPPARGREMCGLLSPLALRLDLNAMPDGAYDLRTLRLAAEAGVIEAQGRLDPDGATSDATLRAALPPSATLGALIPDTLGFTAANLTARLTGPLRAPAVAAELTLTEATSSIAPLAALLGPSPRLALSATAPDRIELLTLAGEAIQVEARGRVGGTLDLDLAADLAAPADTPALAGAARLAARLTGPATDPTIALTAHSDRLTIAGRRLEALALEARIATPASAPTLRAEATGAFDSLPLSLRLDAAPEADGWIGIAAAELAFGPARLAASGRLRPDPLLLDGTATLAAAELAPFSRLLGQPLAGALRLSATARPRDGAQGITASLDAPALRGFGLEAQALAASLDGTLAAFDWTLAGRLNGVQAEARGRLAQAGGGGRLDIAALRATAAGETLRLAAPARITLDPDGGVEIGTLTLALPRNATLRAEGRWGPQRADITARLSPFNLAALAPLLPDVAPAGTLGAEARISGPVGAPEASLTLRASGLRAGAPWGRGLPAGELRADLRRTGDGAVSGTADLRLGAAARLAAAARLPRGFGAANPLEGSLEGVLDLLPLTSPLLAAGGDRVTGRLALNLRTSGPAEMPQLAGEARLTGGSYRSPLAGIAITDIAGTLRPDGPLLRADITGRTAGNGRLALTGAIEPLARHLPLDLRLVASNAQPIASDLLRAVLDAELTLAGRLGTGATLAGPIRVQRAELAIPDRLPRAVRSLGPVTERGTPPGRPATRPLARRAAEGGGGGDATGPILLALQLRAPGNVFVRGRGVDAELGGELSIGGRLEAPEITGELALRRGDVAVIGRRLAFERGRLLFQGGVMPELDFVAASQAGPVTARVAVTGPPTAPEITFSSTPDLPQDEILARLLFDRPLRDLSPFEVVQLAQALAGATGLAGGGTGGVLERVRQALALDRLAVGGGGEGAGRGTAAEERAGPTLEAGRYVAPGVYVGVRQGTEAGSSRVGVRVDLTRRLRLEAETGDRQAGERVGVSMEWEWGR